MGLVLSSKAFAFDIHKSIFGLCGSKSNVMDFRRHDTTCSGITGGICRDCNCALAVRTSSTWRL